MPQPEFFRKLGLFVLPQFLDSATCRKISSEIAASPKEKGRVLRADCDNIDEFFRIAQYGRVKKTTKTLVRERIISIRPELERHFGATLGEIEGPDFLSYSTGGFFLPHSDANEKSPPEIRHRRISMIAFLNAQSEQPITGTYCGGSLTFYGLLGGAWEKYGFSLEAKPGLLIAFRATTLHEVTEVTGGERFTAIGWFLDKGGDFPG